MRTNRIIAVASCLVEDEKGLQVGLYFLRQKNSTAYACLSKASKRRLNCTLTRWHKQGLLLLDLRPDGWSAYPLYE